MQQIKNILILIVLVWCSTTSLHADDDTTLPIKLDPIEKPGPHKPKAPAHLQVQAYYNGVGIVITSNDALQADVLIYDNLTGEQYYNGLAMIAPSFFCSIPADASVVSIIITTSSTEYQGVLYK